MPRWEYRKIDVATAPRRGDEIDLLDAEGDQGWELVGITSNGSAYFKRELDPPAPAARRRTAAGRASGGEGSARPQSGPPERE